MAPRFLDVAGNIEEYNDRPTEVKNGLLLLK